MASISAKSGKLFISFNPAKGVRFKEYSNLTDSKSNRIRLNILCQKIQSDIDNGTFIYADYFPDSKNCLKFALLQQQKQQKSQSLLAAIAEPTANSNAPHFSSFAEQWLDENSSLWRKSHISSVQAILKAHLLPAFGDKLIDCISYEEIVAFRNTLAKVNPETGSSRSPATVNKILKNLRMILTEAADRYNFTSPMKKVKLLKEQKHHIEPFTLAEVKLILQYVRADYRIYFLIRFFTGMRSGEINGLKWRYVDFEQGIIMVRETYMDGHFDYTKNDGSQREIQMSAQVLQALREQYASTGHQEMVFCTANGQPLDNHNVSNRVWHPLLRFLSLRKRRMYETRHTAATLWLAAGEAPEWIARQLGHVDTTMLFKVYSRYVPNLTRRDGSALEQLLQANGFVAEVQHV